MEGSSSKERKLNMLSGGYNIDGLLVRMLIKFGLGIWLGFEFILISTVSKLIRVKLIE